MRKNCTYDGSVVYCLEGIDNGSNLKNLWIDKESNYDVEYEKLFDGCVIYADGFKYEPQDKLYYKLNNDMGRVRLKFIPYHCFANRGETDMCVWVNLGK